MSVPERPEIPRKLFSDLLADDPEMRELVVEFVDDLSDRLAKLQQAYEELDWELLTKLAHQLKGAAGSYGYSTLSQLAATMEEHFRTHSADRFKHWMEQLEAFADAARAGLEEPQQT